jgi:hypothetical protein
MTDIPATITVEVPEAVVAEPLEAHPIPEGPEPVVEEPIVEEIIDSEVEDESTPLINKIGHVFAVPAMGIGHAFTRTHRAFSRRLDRTLDIRSGRKFVAAAQRKALAEIGEKQRNAENA